MTQNGPLSESQSALMATFVETKQGLASGLPSEQLVVSAHLSHACWRANTTSQTELTVAWGPSGRGSGADFLERCWIPTEEPPIRLLPSSNAI